MLYLLQVIRPSRSNALESSRAHRIWDTNKEDYAPCKPGVLISHPGEIPRLGDQTLSGDTTNPAYSGSSERLCMSNYSGSDPLMVSDSSQSCLSEETYSSPAVSSDWGRSWTTARTSPSVPSENGNRLDDGSIRVLQGRIEQPPSFELEGAPATVDLPGAPRNRSWGPLLDVPDHQPISSASPQPENSGNAHPNKKVSDETPSLLGSPVWPAVGLALAFGVLVLLRWIKK